MRKLRMISLGKISKAPNVLTLRSSRKFFATFAVKKILTAENAEVSQSSQGKPFVQRGKRRFQLMSWAAAWVVTIALLDLAAVGQGKQDVDLIVSGGLVVTMDGARTILHDGGVAIRRDAIVAVGPRAEVEALYKGEQTIDARGRLVLPGFINGHTHVPMTLFRGLHDDVTLNDWLYKYIFPAEAKNVNEEFVRWGTRLAAAEQIRSGVSTFADMYYFEDTVAEETKAAGMRGVLGETFIDRMRRRWRRNITRRF
jgi:5-methylthioadenosine/S-adenosylhomocysteine deaminase